MTHLASPPNTPAQTKKLICVCSGCLKPRLSPSLVTFIPTSQKASRLKRLHLLPCAFAFQLPDLWIWWEGNVTWFVYVPANMVMLVYQLFDFLPKSSVWPLTKKQSQASVSHRMKIPLCGLDINRVVHQRTCKCPLQRWVGTVKDCRQMRWEQQQTWCSHRRRQIHKSMSVTWNKQGNASNHFHQSRNHFDDNTVDHQFSFSAFVSVTTCASAAALEASSSILAVSQQREKVCCSLQRSAGFHRRRSHVGTLVHPVSGGIASQSWETNEQKLWDGRRIFFHKLCAYN